MLSDVIQALLPTVLVVALGALARHLRWFSEKADEGIMHLVVNLFYPAMLFSFILGNPLLKSFSLVLIPVVLGFLSILIGFAVAILMTRGMARYTRVDRRTFAFSTGIYNFGYLPIPITLALFGSETVGVLLVFNAGVDMAIWSVGIMLISGSLGREWKQKLFNAPFLALITALLLNGFHLDKLLPRFVFDTVGLIGACAIPLGLLLSGGVIYDLLRRSSLFRDPAVPFFGCLHRLILIPSLFILAAVLVPLQHPLPEILVVQAAMPAGLFTIVLAQHYGGNPKIALQVIAWTAALSAITLPTWLLIGLRWVQ